MSIASSRQQSRHLPAFILLALAEVPSHGGALQAALNKSLPTLKADSAAIYRTLKTLEKDGEVQGEWDMSGSGPAIKIYSLTPAGWDKLGLWLEDVRARMQNLTYFVEAHSRLKRPRLE
jgi:PadR family transcriptional regulator, regulatory protein PadR